MMAIDVASLLAIEIAKERALAKKVSLSTTAFTSPAFSARRIASITCEERLNACA